MSRAAGTLKDALKQVLIPGRLFEELGFTYLGPIDGHDIFRLRQVIGDAVRRKGPVLVHVLTQKGKGYRPSEQNPEKYHGIGPLMDAAKKTRPTYSEVFGARLTSLAADDPQLVAITAAMPEGTGLSAFAERFPGRFYDVGIAEQHAVTLAAGMAAGGLKPVVAIYSTFLQRAYDQVLHDVALQELPVVFAVDRAGIVGSDGATHQGVFDISFLRSIPNLTIIAPSCEEDLAGMLAVAVALNRPVAIRYPRGTAEECKWEDVRKPFQVGKSLQIRTGKEAAILAVGSMVFPALRAAEELSKKGKDVAVVDVRSIKPLDRELIMSLAEETGHLVTVEEHVLSGGFGSAVLELLAGAGIDAKVTRLGIPDEFVEHGSIKELRRKYGLDSAGIAAAVEEASSGRFITALVGNGS